MQSGRDELLPPEIGIDSDATLQPRGPHIAYLASDRRVAVYDACLRTTQMVSPPGRECQLPQWSPDGRRLAFVMVYYEPPGQRYAVFSVAIGDGRPPRQEAAAASWWTWDASGQRILYVLDARVPNAHRLKGNHGRAVATEATGRAKWSPDRSRLASLARRNGSMKVCDLVILGRHLAPLARIPIGTLEQWPQSMVWSPDGSAVVFDTAEAPRWVGDEHPRVRYVADLARGGELRKASPPLQDSLPVGPVRLAGRWQLLLIRSDRRSLLAMDGLGAPAHPLARLQDDGSLTFESASTKED